jgi:thiamine kinase-like enzyme
MPEWRNADVVRSEPVGGLTNTNYLVVVDGERFAVRMSGPNAESLGIDRRTERAVLRSASEAGIGAEVVRCTPEGHLVTRWIDGRHWEPGEYKTAATLRRVVSAVRQVHALPPVATPLSVFDRIDLYAHRAQSAGIAFPADWDAFVDELDEIRTRTANEERHYRLCHNDLFSVNLIDDGSVRIIDWEFAGMADPYYDLATLVYAYDEDGPLSPDLEDVLLESYFGTVDSGHRERLRDMKLALLVFTAMWGMLQAALQAEGTVSPNDWFSPLDYAYDTIERARAIT